MNCLGYERYVSQGGDWGSVVADAMARQNPVSPGYGISDSPAGLAAFFYDTFNDWTYSGGDAEKATHAR